MQLHDELWVIRGSRPVLWTFPFYVIHYNRDEHEAFPAVPLLKCQEEAVKLRMFETGARRVNGLWMIPKIELIRMGKLMEPGTDPELCFSWERPRLAQQEKFRPHLREDRDEFLDALYQEGVGASRDEVEHWWFLFCQHALDWIVNKEKPVDMYFANLVPLPYRNEWLELVEDKREKVEHTLKTLRKRERLVRYLLQPYLLAGEKDNLLRRTLEMELKPLWWKTIKRVESERRSRLTAIEYGAEVKESMRRAVPAAVRIYRAYVAQKNALLMRFGSGGPTRGYSVLSFERKEKKRPPDWGTSDKYRKAVENRKEKIRRFHERMARKNAGLSAV